MTFYRIGKTTAGFVVGLLLMVLVGLGSYRSMAQLNQNSAQVTHTYQVLSELDDILSELKDIETGQRGFILTGEEQYLEPYQSGLQMVEPETKRLRVLIADDPAQQRRLAILEPLIIQKLAFTQETIELRRTEGFDTASHMLATGRGKRLMDEIRQIIQEMRAEEQRLLEERSVQTAARSQSTLFLGSAGSLLAITLVAGASFVVNRDVRKRKQVEERLRQERNFNAGVLDTTGALVVVLDAEGRIVRFNHACEQTTGYQFDEVRGRHFWSLALFSGDPALAQSGLKAIHADQFPNQREAWLVSRTGERRVIAWANTALLDGEGKPEYIISVGSNLTERKRAEERLRNLYDVAAAHHLGFDDKIHRLLTMGCQEFNLDIGVVGEVAGQRYEIMHAVDIDAAVMSGSTYDLGDTYCAEALRLGGPVAVEHVAESKLQARPCYAIFHLEAYLGTPIVVNGVVYGTLAFSSLQPHPVAFTSADKEFLKLMAQWVGSELERRQAEVKLQASEAELRALFAAMTDNIFVLDANGRYRKVAPTQPVLTEQVGVDYVGKTLHEVFQPQQAELFLRCIQRALATQHTVHTEYCLEVDGQALWFAAAVSPMLDDTVIWVARDITKRKRAEEQVVQTVAALEAQYYQAEKAHSESNAVLDATSEGMALVAPDHRFLTVNRRFSELFGVGTDQVVGRRLTELEGELQRVFAEAASMQGQDGQHSDGAGDARGTFREIVVQQSPVQRELELFSTPVRRADTEHLGRLYVFRDITHEREVDRMKSEFVSLVSHELRTPLTSIKGYIDLVLDEEVGDITADQRDFLEIAKTNADRLVTLTNDLLDVSRIEAGKIELQRQPVDVAQLVRRVSTTLRPQLEAKDQRLKLELAPTLPLISADGDRITQVLTNLLSNAHKYTPKGGHIVIAATHEPTQVRIEVQDTGIGLAAEEQAQLFTKFFRARNRTTQEVGGTGLGLAIVKSLVELHGGGVAVASTPGRGSTFSVTLPMA